MSPSCPWWAGRSLTSGLCPSCKGGWAFAFYFREVGFTLWGFPHREGGCSKDNGVLCMWQMSLLHPRQLLISKYMKEWCVDKGRGEEILLRGSVAVVVSMSPISSESPYLCSPSLLAASVCISSAGVECLGINTTQQLSVNQWAHLPCSWWVRTRT